MGDRRGYSRSGSTSSSANGTGPWTRRLAAWLSSLGSWLVALIRGRLRCSVEPDALAQVIETAVHALERGYLGAAAAQLSFELGSKRLSPSDRAFVVFAIACVFAAAGSEQQAERRLNELEAYPAATPLEARQFQAPRSVLLANARRVASHPDAQPAVSVEIAAMLGHIHESARRRRHSGLPDARVHRGG